MNPIVRGDLRARVAGPKARTLYTIFLGLLGAVAVLSLPPELGRLDEIRGESLLLTILLLETIFIAYLTGAVASGEITIDGEKSVEDLATARFSSRGIGIGKVLSAVGFAGVLVIFAAPIMSVIAVVQGERLNVIVRAGLVTVLFAGTVGALGAIYSAVIESDFSRSFFHWVTLLVLIAGGAALPDPWNMISPVHSIPAAIHGSGGLALLVVSIGYVGIIVTSMWMIHFRVEVIRHHAPVF